MCLFYQICKSATSKILVPDKLSSAKAVIKDLATELTSQAFGSTPPEKSVAKE